MMLSATSVPSSCSYLTPPSTPPHDHLARDPIAEIASACITSPDRWITLGIDGAQRRKARLVTRNREALFFPLSPESRKRHSEEMSPQKKSLTPPALSPKTQEDITFHIESRLQSLTHTFAAIGAFMSSGLEVKCGRALIQAGKGSRNTPAAHVSFLPFVSLRLPKEGQKEDASWTACCQNSTWKESLCKAAGVQPSSPTAERELRRELARGVLLQGLTAATGAITTELLLAANVADSSMEKTLRPKLIEILNEITQHGMLWRTAWRTGLESVAQSIADLRHPNATSSSSSSFPATSLTSPGEDKQWKKEWKAQQIQNVLQIYQEAVLATQSSGLLPQMTKTPEAPTSAGTLGQALASVRRRSWSVSQADDLDTPADASLKRPCPPSSSRSLVF